jgi:hypothetical protein
VKAALAQIYSFNCDAEKRLRVKKRILCMIRVICCVPLSDQERKKIISELRFGLWPNHAREKFIVPHTDIQIRTKFTLAKHSPNRYFKSSSVRCRSRQYKPKRNVFVIWLHPDKSKQEILLFFFSCTFQYPIFYLPSRYRTFHHSEHICT